METIKLVLVTVYSTFFLGFDNFSSIEILSVANHGFMSPYCCAYIGENGSSPENLKKSAMRPVAPFGGGDTS
jgi:hypothetical protein